MMYQVKKLNDINSLIIGKQSTSSTILKDHHRLTLLAKDNNHYKISLPIELPKNIHQHINDKIH